MAHGDADWNEVTVTKLRALWASGFSTAEIGRRLNISKNAVVGKAHRLNLPPRPSPIRRGGEVNEAKPRKVAAHISKHVASEVAKPRSVVPIREERQLVSHAGKLVCCWPFGDPGTPSFRFCNAKTVVKKPYCPEHCEKAYVTIERRERVA